MISSIVDADGFLVYQGNDIDTKFATVLAKAGHSRVEGTVAGVDKPKWNGSEWVEGHVVTYTELRKAEYAKLNQFEMQFDDQRDSTTTWVDAVNAIKVQFPKPS
jgi:hypothetical protein